MSPGAASQPNQPLSLSWREYLRMRPAPFTRRRVSAPTPRQRPKSRFPFKNNRSLRTNSKRSRLVANALWAQKRLALAQGQANGISESFDAIVVGSGYGGSVAALRLAEKGHRVLLLERGGEYLPGDFANDWSMLPKFFRANLPGQPLPLGRASGLIEMTLGQGMAAVTGNGLGGGSLINAGVVIRPDADVFAQEAWPSSIRYAMGTAVGMSHLDQAFRTAEGALGAASFVTPSTSKMAAFGDLAKALDQKVTTAALTMDPTRCIQCGNCAAGCNVAGAKKDLRSTYLARAMATNRVQIVTQAEVYRFAQEPPSADPTKGASRRWSLWVFSTDAQHQKSSRQEAGHEHDIVSDPASTLRVLTTELLIISAGTLGSTQLLQRSQALSGEALAFSAALGTRLSGNGDSISVLMEPEQPVNAVGQTVSPIPAPGNPTPPGPQSRKVGPTITGMVNLRDLSKPLPQRLLLQDGAIPSAMSRAFEELIATLLTLKQADHWAFQRPVPLASSETGDPLAASSELANRAQVLLAMGHDGSPGRMVWMPGTDGSAMVMPTPEDLPVYKEQEALFRKLAQRGIYLHNPLWKALPDSATQLMSGEPTPKLLTSVHPLGGCPMGDDPTSSVVNHLGQVWMREPGYPGRQNPPPLGIQQAAPNAPTVYPGLYVLDGSVVPTSLGCNPLLTITALAERAMALAFVPRKAAPATQPLQSPARPSASVQPVKKITIDAALSETLRAPSGSFKGRWSQATPNSARELVLSATLATQDLEQTLKEASHPFTISKAELTLGERTNSGGFSRLASYTLAPENDTHGGAASFHFLRATGHGSSGYWPLWQAVASCLLLLALPMAAYWGLAACSSWAKGQPLFLFLAAVGAFLFACMLPFPRTFLTWFLLRGWADIGSTPKGSAFSGFKSMVHALEKREMAYHLPLVRSWPGESSKAFPDAVVLTASKTVMYRATVGQLFGWAWREARAMIDAAETDSPPLRPSYWEQLMNAQASVRESQSAKRHGADLFKGPLNMGFENLFSRKVAQLGSRGDTTSGLLLLSGYALLVARFAIKTRLFDFRLPNHSGLPVLDTASATDLALRLQPQGLPDSTGQEIQPTLHWINVPRGHSSADTGDESTANLQLRLWRYAREENEPIEVLLATAWHTPGQKVRRVKSVLLLHAFGQSGLTFTYKAKGSSSGSNLAEAFYNSGYEVWVLDSRMSSRSGYAEQAMNVDMMGAHDVPQAVDHIVSVLANELPCKAPQDAPLQIAVFAQCIGAASLWMAALSGKLTHANGTSKLSSAMFSQVHALPIGSPLTRSKVWLPSLLQKFLPSIAFAVRGPQDSWAWQALDRLLSTLPAPKAERALSSNEDAVATCRRIRFIESPLFFHRNMDAGTVNEMNRLFGPASLRLFAHARRFVEHKRLVDEDGLNRYVTDHNLNDHLRFPIALLHGQENELFDVSGAHETAQWLQRHPRYQENPPKLIIVEGYGHLDVLLGKTAAKDVFSDVLQHFNHAFNLPPPPTLPPLGWHIAPPRVGPLVGWVSRSGQDLKVRLTVMLDDHLTSANSRVLVRRRNDQGAFKLLPASVQFEALKTPTSPLDAGQFPLYLRFASLDITLPCGPTQTTAPASPALEFQIVVVHTDPAFGRAPPRLPWPPDLSDSELDTAIKTEEESIARHNVTAALNRLPATVPLAEKICCSVPDATRRALFPEQGSARSRVKFLVTSCRHPGLSLDQERIDRQLPSDGTDAAFALFVGDQIYADATAGLVDPTSPIERYLERHISAFTSPAMRRFLANMPTLMTPDDHEWINEFPLASPLFNWSWPDWAPGSAFQTRERSWYEWANDSVAHFQKLQWPPTAGDDRWVDAGPIGPVRIFVMDTRQDRKRKKAMVVKDETLDDLRDWLAAGSENFLNIIVTGSVALPGLYPDADPSNPGPTDTWQHAPAQRQRLMDMLVDDSLSHRRRFLLISGDYHISAAVEIHAREQSVGAAIIAPPLYAPLPYVNSRPEHLWLNERLTANGHQLALNVPGDAEAQPGNGTACIQVSRMEEGFEVRFTRDLLCLEAGTGSTFTATIRL